MGQHFETLIIPRLKKIAYAPDWKDGKPKERDSGISHAFKVIRLESYEDALNNLRLVRTQEQDVALNTAPERVGDEYLLSYFLEVESAASASLLDLEQLRDPFAYKLKIAASSAGQTVDTNIDLVETFNWLLGLKVRHIDVNKGFLTVPGERRQGGRTLVIWRTLSDDATVDNKALEAFLAKLKVNPADTEFAYIYVNGSHTLADPHNKIHLIEEAFQRLMFDMPDFGMEA
jgi:adenine-specific DNA-methyltransferase